jgi:hypothetical protein
MAMSKLAALVPILLAILLSGCGPNERILRSAEENREAAGDAAGNTAPARSGFEHDLTAMRNADLSFIYVFRRRDGGVMDPDDKRFIGQNTPSEMNRRALTDEGKAVMIGSNFRLPDENLNAFKARFAFEDYSKPDAETTNTNAGSTP